MRHKPRRQFWRRKNVLVTGGASFIGSHIVTKLVEELGAWVLVADDMSSGAWTNLDHIGHDEQMDVMVTDLRDTNDARLAAQDMDIVIHLAACHGGRGFIDANPALCSNNMALDGIVFEAAQAEGVERIVYASSACIYPPALQMDELHPGKLVEVEGNGTSSDGMYGFAKWAGERSLKAYHEQFGMKGVSCRYFTAYGPRENETHAVMALVGKAFVKMDPYEIWGSGKQSRNFTYIDDIVNGTLIAAESIDDCSPINIGREDQISINELSEIIFDIVGWRPNEIKRDLEAPIGVRSRAADLSMCRRKLDWVPEVSFRKGLEQTIDWYYTVNDGVEFDIHDRLMDRCA